MFASTCVFAIPLAAAREPAANWADPQSLGAMIDHLLARSIRAAFADEMLPDSLPLWWANAGATMDRLVEDLGPSAPILGAVALIASWVGPAKLADRRALAVISAWLVGSTIYAVGINPMGGVDRQTGLVLGWCVVLLVAVNLDGWLRERPRLRHGVMPVVWTILVVPAAIRSVGDFATMPSWAPHAWARAALGQLPPRALLLTQTDDLSAAVTWACVVEGMRPDVLAWPGQHLHRPPAVGRRARHRAVWDAVAAAGSEVQRIEAAIAAHDGPVALENAASGVFATVAFDGPFAALPLAIQRSVAAPDGATPDVLGQLARWSSRLPSAEDRRRLAVAIAEWARGHVRRGGELGEAVAALQSVLTEVDPDHVGSMITLGGLFDRMGDVPSAIDWTRRALAADPTRQVTLLNLALYLSRDAGADPVHASARADALAEARALAERAVALRPWRPEPWMRLGDVRAASGDRVGAEQARERARALATEARAR